MRIKQVRELITDAVLAERERCAKIADANDTECGDLGDKVASLIAAEIRSARPPIIKVIRPETAAAHPERVDRDTIVAGASYAGLD